MVDLRSVDINLIEVLDAVLTEQNLTRAGESLGMAQPAVSGALARLRQQFGDPLIVRKGRSSELTPVALRLQPAVRRAMVEIRTTLDFMPTFDPAATTRTFYVSGSDYAMGELSGPLQTLFREHAPGAHLDFASLPAAGVDPTDLLRRDVLVSSTAAGLPGKNRSLFLDRFVCIVARDNSRLQRTDRLTIDDLREMRHAHTYLGSSVITPVDDMLAEVGVVPRLGVAVYGFIKVPFMVAGTDLIGFVPERIFLRYGEHLGLRVVDTPIPPRTLIEAAFWHPSRTNDPAIRWLLEMLVRAAEIVEFGELQTV